MKQQTFINLTLAGGGSLLACLIAFIDPHVTARDYVFVCIGIWAMAAGHFVTQTLMNLKSHEKTDPTHPSA